MAKAGPRSGRTRSTNNASEVDPTPRGGNRAAGQEETRTRSGTGAVAPGGTRKESRGEAFVRKVETDRKIKALASEGKSIKAIAAALRVGRPRVRRVLATTEDEVEEIRAEYLRGVPKKGLKKWFRHDMDVINDVIKDLDPGWKGRRRYVHATDDRWRGPWPPKEKVRGIWRHRARARWEARYGAIEPGARIVRIQADLPREAIDNITNLAKVGPRTQRLLAQARRFGRDRREPRWAAEIKEEIRKAAARAGEDVVFGEWEPEED